MVFVLFLSSLLYLGCLTTPIKAAESGDVEDYISDINSPIQDIIGEQYIGGDFVSLALSKIGGRTVSADRSELLNVGRSAATDLEIESSLCRINKIIEFQPQVTDYQNYSEILYRKDYIFEADVQINTVSALSDLGFKEASVSLDLLDAFYTVTPEYIDDSWFGCSNSFRAEYSQYDSNNVGWVLVGDMRSSFKFIEVKGGYWTKYSWWDLPGYYPDGWRNVAGGFGITEPTPISFSININPSFANFPQTQIVDDQGSTITYLSGWTGVATVWNEGFEGGLISGQSNLITEPQTHVATAEYKESNIGQVGDNLPESTSSLTPGLSPITHDDAKGLISGVSYNSGGDVGLWEKTTKIETEPLEIRGQPENSMLPMRFANQDLPVLLNYEYDQSIVNYRADSIEFDYIIQKCKPRTNMHMVQYNWNSRSVYIRRTIQYFSGCFTLGCERKTDLGAKIELNQYGSGVTNFLPYAYQIFDVYLRDKIQFRVPVFVKYQFEKGDDLPQNDLDIEGSMTTSDTSENWTLGTPYEISEDRVWTTGRGVFGDTNASFFLDTTAGASWESNLWGGIMDWFSDVWGIIITIIVLSGVAIGIYIVYVVVKKSKRKSDIQYKAAKRQVK